MSHQGYVETFTSTAVWTLPNLVGLNAIRTPVFVSICLVFDLGTYQLGIDALRPRTFPRLDYEHYPQGDQEKG
ncbi:MAG: hypothetical protein ACE1ZS_02285 [Candidatus Poribacteria bacterium]